MTTIAYHHKSKQIAVDSRTSCGSDISTDKANKIKKKNGVVFFLAGEVPAIEDLINKYPDGDFGCEDVGGIVVIDGVAYSVFVKDKKLKTSALTYNYSDGSGHQYAMAAMDFGRTAKQAVEYAKTRDLYTGGRVRVYNIK